MKCPSCSADLYSETVSCPRCGIYLQGVGATLPGSASRPASTLRAKPRTGTNTRKRWSIGGIVIGVFTLFFELFFRQALWSGYLIYQQHSAVEASSGYQEGLHAAESSPQLQQLLGQPMDTSGFVLGELRRARDSDFIEWWVPLKGPKGSGYLYGVANRVGNHWDYSRLAFVPSEGAARIDLTVPPRQEQLRVADAVRKVYLVPLDASSAKAISWAPAYYTARLGLNVIILPQISLPASVIDIERRQIVADKALVALREAEREWTDDPSAVVIGITSQDMYISQFDWAYSVNLRLRRFAIISTARLEPFSDLAPRQRRLLRMLLLERWNTELPGARLQKLLSKNILVECFDLPLSADYTSVLASGAQTWWDVDWMGNEIIGAAGRWTPSVEDGDPEVSFMTEAGRPPVWRFDGLDDPKDTSSQALTSDIRFGLVTRRKTDYALKDFAFSRAYRNRWEQPMSFGIGTIHTLDIFLVGEMGRYIELIYTNGSRIRFERDKSPAAANRQVYLPTYNPGEHGFEKAVFDGNTWRLTTKDRWVYFFPYLPQAYRYRVTVLTDFTDPQGRQFDMVRNEAGDLQSLHTPSGQFLRFQYDSAHRIASIEDSDSRVLQYQYDQAGRLSRVSDSAGEGESYTYDSLGRMAEVRDLAGTLLLKNIYSPDDYVAAQTLGDGRSFSYFYERDAAGKLSRSFVTDPDGYVTQFDFSADGKSFVRSLPIRSDFARSTEAAAETIQPAKSVR